MKLAAALPHARARRRSAFTLLEVLVVVAIIVILATVASVAVFRNLDDAKKTQAQLKAKTIDTALKSYMANPNFDGDMNNIQITSLLQPPWGGTSYLPNGQADMLDPWNKQYQIQPSTGPDGAPTFLIMTTSDDGIPISQYGVGPKAIPNQ